jgi:hypothetical protein
MPCPGHDNESFRELKPLEAIEFLLDAASMEVATSPAGRSAFGGGAPPRFGGTLGPFSPAFRGSKIASLSAMALSYCGFQSPSPPTSPSANIKLSVAVPAVSRHEIPVVFSKCRDFLHLAATLVCGHSINSRYPRTPFPFKPACS